MAKFVVIVGPQAVGKMTVGQELAKITNLKLLHNHMTIEVLTKIFDYDKETFRKLNINFRTQIFEEFSKSNEYGIIFTTCFDFDFEEEKEILERWRNMFKKNGGECYFIELETTLEERLRRNKTENRLANKPSKRNLEWSEKDILKSVKKYRFNSHPGEVNYENYLRINNTDISAEEVAKRIKEKFEL
jgi:hypothetical protein